MKNLTRLLGSGLIALGLAAVAPASADVVDDIIARGELRVAVQTQGPPVSFVDKNGERTGFASGVVEVRAAERGVWAKPAGCCR